jgi:hypothetical protein
LNPALVFAALTKQHSRKKAKSLVKETPDPPPHYSTHQAHEQAPRNPGVWKLDPLPWRGLQLPSPSVWPPRSCPLASQAHLALAPSRTSRPIWENWGGDGRVHDPNTLSIPPLPSCSHLALEYYFPFLSSPRRAGLSRGLPCAGTWFPVCIPQSRGPPNLEGLGRPGGATAVGGGPLINTPPHTAQSSHAVR